MQAGPIRVLAACLREHGGRSVGNDVWRRERTGAPADRAAARIRLVGQRGVDHVAVPFSVAEYAALGRLAPVPRRSCSDCSVPMALDGSYPAQGA